MTETNDILNTQTEFLMTSELFSSEIGCIINYDKKRNDCYIRRGNKEKGGVKKKVKADKKGFKAQKIDFLGSLGSQGEEIKNSRKRSVCMEFSSELQSEFDGLSGNFESNAVSFINLQEKKYCKLTDSSFFFSDEISTDGSFGNERRSVKSHDSIYDGLNLSSLTVKKTNFLNSRPFKHWTLDSKRKSKNHSVPNPVLLNKENRKLNSLWDDYNAGICCSLPVVKSKEADSLMRISVDTVNEMLQTGSSNFCVIDCRFEYEYQGGHIEGAIHINTPDQMDSFYRGNETTILIFHCEYSSIRAPRMARYLRNLDRKLNDYPDLKFPEIYIMEGGYKLFYEKYSGLCTPMHYVSMDDANETFAKDKLS